MRIAIAALVAFLLLAPVSEARWVRAERAQRVAMDYWAKRGYGWSAECPTIATTRGHLDAHIAFAYYASRCEIVLDRAWLARVHGPKLWWAFCTIYTHEWGHMIGWRDPMTGDTHSSGRRHLMTADPNTHKVPGLCR